MPLDRTQVLLDAPLAAAVTGLVGESVAVPYGARSLAVLANFAYGSGGTATKAYVQTSLDGGATWVDVMAFAFTTSAAKKISAVRDNIALAAAYTPTDGSLTDDTIKDGLLGDRIRVKLTTTGTYAGASSLKLTAHFNE